MKPLGDRGRHVIYNRHDIYRFGGSEKRMVSKKAQRTFRYLDVDAPKSLQVSLAESVRQQTLEVNQFEVGWGVEARPVQTSRPRGR